MTAREIRFLSFRAGSETFLIDIMAVQQVFPYSGPKLVVSDKEIPVIDVRGRLIADRAANAEQPMVLLTHTASGAIGLKVDEVRRPITLNADELLPAPEKVRGVRGEFLVAIAPHGEQVLLVLDVDSLAKG